MTKTKSPRKNNKQMLEDSHHTIAPFPGRYLDPRDFHEVIMKTSLEFKKIKLPKPAKRYSKIGV